MGLKNRSRNAPPAGPGDEVLESYLVNRPERGGVRTILLWKSCWEHMRRTPPREAWVTMERIEATLLEPEVVCPDLDLPEFRDVYARPAGPRDWLWVVVHYEEADDDWVVTAYNEKRPPR
jgi:hypothetical protein